LSFLRKQESHEIPVCTGMTDTVPPSRGRPVFAEPIIKFSKLHLLAMLFLLSINLFGFYNSSFPLFVKILCSTFVFLFCLHILFRTILNPGQLPPEFKLLYAKIWRYAMVLIVRDSISGKKKRYFFSRDQFTLMQWKILRRKLRFSLKP